MVAKDFGMRLVPMDLVLDEAKMCFTKVEFTNGNETHLINLNDFRIKGLSMTGFISVDHTRGGTAQCAGRVEDFDFCGARAGHVKTTDMAGSKWSIRILANIRNSSATDVKADVVDVDLVKCAFKIGIIMPEEALCAALSVRLTEHVGHLVMELQNLDLVQQLIVLDSPKHQLHAQLPALSGSSKTKSEQQHRGPIKTRMHS